MLEVFIMGFQFAVFPFFISGEQLLGFLVTFSC